MSLALGTLITSFIGFITIYFLASSAGLLSERSGIVNIALDGKMIIGALVFASMYQIDGYADQMGWMAPFIALFIAGLAGALYSTLLSIATINFMANQVIAGTALNLLAPAISLIVLKTWFGTESVTIIGADLGTWAGTINTFILVSFLLSIVFVIVLWFIINKTYLGLRLRSSGENPYALETAGISVKKTRWISLTIAGFLAGIAGGLFPVVVGGTFGGTVNGTGYLAIGILIVGQWSVFGIVISSIMFSLLSTLITSSYFSALIPIPSELLNVLPFLIPLGVLMVYTSQGGPKSSGIPYKKDQR